MKFTKVVATLALTAAVAIPVLAADLNGKILISADQLTFNGKENKASAEGNVVITKDDKTMTGKSGWYNTKSQEAFLTGGVSMIGANMSMVAQELHSYNNEEIHATGAVHLQKDNRQVFGDAVNYNSKTEYSVVEGNGRLVLDDSTLTANHIEAWIKEIRAVGTGNVTLHSDSRQLDATGERIDYTQTPNQNDGVAILSGDAKAIQNGNVWTGKTLRVKMADNSVESLDGRSTLVIVPNK